jgi:hypothetical protein
MPTLFRELAQALDGMPALLSARAKRTDTIIRKLRREGTMQLTTMADIVGFRIVVDCIATQRLVIDRMLKDLPVQKTQDYLIEPKKTGYRGVHIVFAVKQHLPDVSEATNFTCEIQIRTVLQHLWSTESESFGEQVKEGGGSDAHRAYLMALSDRLRAEEEAHPDVCQRDDLRSLRDVTFHSFVFDKRLGRVVNFDSYGTDDDLAIEHFALLETLHSSNLSKEVVLLAAPSVADELSVTHTRYFEPEGRPNIPSQFMDGLIRP